jgi:hypothetical protein
MGLDGPLGRRHMLALGVGSLVAAALRKEPAAAAPPPPCSPVIPPNHGLANGGPCPYPIPWLDKNGNHNQASAPNVELSHIYHFTGRLARCSGFHGMGTDNTGKRLSWGTATTDYGIMDGEYWAGRQSHRAIFAHT